MEITSPAKPAYRIPPASEFNARPRNGYKVVSTFTGAGGSCLGWRMAGYEVVWASEFIPAAQDTYRANHDSHLDTRDVRDVSAESILRSIDMRRGDLDIFDGSPPCASFSLAGSRSKHWGEVKKYSDTRQRTDDLFDEYIRLVDGLLPRIFVAENVPSLAQGVAIGYFKKIMRALSSKGYRVRASILRADWLGVPQSRRRLFIVGVRDDLKLDPVFPKPLSYRYSIVDACPWVIPNVNYDDFPDAPSAEERAEVALAHRKLGETWDRAKIGEKPGEDVPGPFQFMKSPPHLPVETLCQTGGRVGTATSYHPYERRGWTTTEIVRFGGFPDNFVLTGEPWRRWERINRAVPPPVMEALGRSLAEGVLRKADGR